jgi:hypothetical protein
LTVWSSITLGKQVKGINRGEVDPGLASNWKRHFTNYATKQIVPSQSELLKAKDDLDKQMKKLPDAMKEDIKNKKVSRANVIVRPRNADVDDKKGWTDKPYGQFKFGDPR